MKSVGVENRSRLKSEKSWNKVLVNDVPRKCGVISAASRDEKAESVRQRQTRKKMSVAEKM